jgi:hypothetical protein
MRIFARLCLITLRYTASHNRPAFEPFRLARYAGHDKEKMKAFIFSYRKGGQQNIPNPKDTFSSRRSQ